MARSTVAAGVAEQRLGRIHLFGSDFELALICMQRAVEAAQLAGDTTLEATIRAQHANFLASRF